MTSLLKLEHEKLTLIILAELLHSTSLAGGCLFLTWCNAESLRTERFCRRKGQSIFHQLLKIATKFISFKVPVDSKKLDVTNWCYRSLVGDNGKNADSSGIFVERVLVQFEGKMSPKVADANSSVIPSTEFGLVSAAMLA